jgi:resuscitation-promoting factor RpfB
VIGAFFNPQLAARAGETSPSLVVDGRIPITVSLIVDDVSRTFETDAATVGDLLNEANIAYDGHDQIAPAAQAKLRPDEIVRVTHVGVWTETVRESIAAPVKNVPSFHVGIGKTKVVDPGRDGLKVLSYIVTRGRDRLAAPRRSLIASQVARTPRPRVVAHGIGEYALTELSQRGLEAVRFAGAAMKMMATAYTANCIGCSGFTKLGQPAGHGIVAVDPRVIPLGTALFIPGYGRAIAGDTGGAIRGNRIDLGSNSTSDAFRFGTRPIIVYVLDH